MAVFANWVIASDGIATMVLCVCGGFMLGSIIEGLVISISGWESMLFFLIVTAVCMITGAIIGYRRVELVAKYLTAVVGSYLFMRGWTYYLGGFPSEIEMYNMMANENSDPLQFTGLFWFYVALFIVGTISFVYIQTNYKTF